MAVTPAGGAGASQRAGGDGTRRDEERRREAPFQLDTRLTFGYRLARRTVRTAVQIWFRPRVIGRGNLPEHGPVVVAPVHRSFADFVFPVFATDRKVFYMAKAELWRWRLLGKALVALGAFPVHRDGADREALRRAEEVLRHGQVLVLFPEGTRGEGPVVGHLHEGPTFLAARTGASVVPIGIGGSERAMPKGHVIARPFAITVVVGPPLAPLDGAGVRRVGRRRLHQATEALRQAVQAAYDEAQRTR